MGEKRIHPQDFFSENPPDRIIGIESEITIQISSNSDLYNDENKFMNDQVIRDAGFRCAGYGYLDTGGRAYLDMQNLEIATAECLGPRQAAAADYAGILQIIDIVDASELEHDGLFRNTGTAIKGVAETTGYHENYLIPRSITSETDFNTLLPSFWASRMWAGAGMVNDGFELSQKIAGIGFQTITNELSNRITHGSKPMAIVPPEGADQDTITPGGDYARLEVRFADANFSKTINFLDLAATSLTLRLVEHKDKINNDLLIAKSFESPGFAAQYFSTDLCFTRTMETLDGDTISAINYQELLLEQALALNEIIELPDDEKIALPLWGHVLDQLKLADLKKNEYAGLLELADFAIRHFYLMKRFDEPQINSYNAEVVAASLAWDRISPSGPAMRYWDKIDSPYVSYSEILKLYDTPPRTRAAARGNLIKDNHGEKYASWNSLKTKNGDYYRFDDPYSVNAVLDEY